MLGLVWSWHRIPRLCYSKFRSTSKFYSGLSLSPISPEKKECRSAVPGSCQMLQLVQSLGHSYKRMPVTHMTQIIDSPVREEQHAASEPCHTHSKRRMTARRSTCPGRPMSFLAKGERGKKGGEKSHLHTFPFRDTPSKLRTIAGRHLLLFEHWKIASLSVDPGNTYIQGECS